MVCSAEVKGVLAETDAGSTRCVECSVSGVLFVAGCGCRSTTRIVIPVRCCDGAENRITHLLSGKLCWHGFDGFAIYCVAIYLLTMNSR